MIILLLLALILLDILNCSTMLCSPALGSLYLSTALKGETMANTSVVLITKSTIVTSDHSVINLERSSSDSVIGVLTYMVPGVVGAVVLIIITIIVVIGIIQCRRHTCVPASSLNSAALQFDNEAYDTK